MARLRMRLIRIGDRDRLGTSEATRTRGGPSVSGSRRAHRHDLAGREIVGIRNWVLGDQEGIRSSKKYTPSVSVWSRSFLWAGLGWPRAWNGVRLGWAGLAGGADFLGYCCYTYSDE